MRRPYYPFLDIIRVAGCFLVILLHVAATNFYTFSDTWPIALFYDSVSRMCVPLFFMLSGFLFMDQPVPSLNKFYCKRYIRVLLPFGAVCAIYFFTPIYADYSLRSYLLHIMLIDYCDYHLWYIYCLLAIYLTLPFFIKTFSDNIKYAWLYVFIWFTIPVTIHLLMRYFGIMSEIPKAGSLHYVVMLSLSYFTGYMGFVVCGFLIKAICLSSDYGKSQLKTSINNYYYIIKIPYCLFVINILIFIMANFAIIYFTYIRSHSLGNPNELFFDNLSPFVVLQAISFFIICTRIRKVWPWIRTLADKTYWIYLLHMLWLRMLLNLWPLPSNGWLALVIPVMTLAVFLMAWLTAIPLRALELWLLRVSKQRVLTYE